VGRGRGHRERRLTWSKQRFAARRYRALKHFNPGDRMTPLRTLAAAALLATVAATSFAQANTPKGATPAPGASGPGMGYGMGPGMGRGMHADASNTYGWSMMTPEERSQHQQRMANMHSADECKAYVDQHHQQMAARAQQHGASSPGAPPHNMCAGMK
jgi:hypothetical protein